MGPKAECYNCIVQPPSLADAPGWSTYQSPGFYNTQGGKYINCHGGFINNSTDTKYIAFNGTYINCSGKFGKLRASTLAENDTPEVELSGFFKGCIGYFKGIASGYFENCKGVYTNQYSINDVSFAPHIPRELTGSAEDAASFPRQTTTGTFVRCNSYGQFPLIEGQGKMALCIDGDYEIINAK
jgi:hypothetical protein